MSFNAVVQTLRPAFLILTPACVLLGFSIAFANTENLNYFHLFLVLIGALSAHAAVNTLNEYFDFKSGLDFHTVKTAFSGGSGSLPENPQVARIVLTAGVIATLISILIGFYFIFEIGPTIFPIGLTGILLIITYTQWINRSPVLCLISPGLGFGLLMVTGTFVVLTGSYTDIPWSITLVPFFLVNNLLLLNQYPDMDADRSAGRRTFPIIFGINNSNIVYGIFALLAYLLIVFEILSDKLTGLAIIATLPFVLSMFALYGAIKYKSEISNYPQHLAANVAATILTPVLLGITIILA